MFSCSPSSLGLILKLKIWSSRRTECCSRWGLGPLFHRKCANPQREHHWESCSHSHLARIKKLSVRVFFHSSLFFSLNLALAAAWRTFWIDALGDSWGPFLVNIHSILRFSIVRARSIGIKNYKMWPIFLFAVENMPSTYFCCRKRGFPAFWAFWRTRRTCGQLGDIRTYINAYMHANTCIHICMYTCIHV